MFFNFSISWKFFWNNTFNTFFQVFLIKLSWNSKKQLIEWDGCNKNIYIYIDVMMVCNLTTQSKNEKKLEDNPFKGKYV
jgi:hypothetical protein